MYKKYKNPKKLYKNKRKHQFPQWKLTKKQKYSNLLGELYTITKCIKKATTRKLEQLKPRKQEVRVNVSVKNPNSQGESN